MPLAKVLLFSNYRLYLHAPCNQVKNICQINNKLTNNFQARSLDSILREAQG